MSADIAAIIFMLAILCGLAIAIMGGTLSWM